MNFSFNIRSIKNRDCQFYWQEVCIELSLSFHIKSIWSWFVCIIWHLSDPFFSFCASYETNLQLEITRIFLPFDFMALKIIPRNIIYGVPSFFFYNAEKQPLLLSKIILRGRFLNIALNKSAIVNGTPIYEPWSIRISTKMLLRKGRDLHLINFIHSISLFWM